MYSNKYERFLKAMFMNWLYVHVLEKGMLESKEK
jgi:hypothetical protein